MLPVLPLTGKILLLVDEYLFVQCHIYVINDKNICLRSEDLCDGAPGVTCVRNGTNATTEKYKFPDIL